MQPSLGNGILGGEAVTILIVCWYLLFFRIERCIGPYIMGMGRTLWTFGSLSLVQL